MTSFASTVNTLMGVGVLVSHIVLVLFLIFFFLEKKFRAKTYRFVDTYIVHLLFGISLSAFVGSLLYSQVVGFLPCELCWVQRIVIYPQALLALIALRKGDKGIVDYLLPLSIIGAVVSLYQSFIQWGFSSVSVLGCTSGAEAECAKVYVKAFGYITIPFMSFTVFAVLIVVTFIYYKARKIHGK